MTDSPTSRRTFLRATAAGAMAVGGGRTFFDGSTADTGDAAGKLVFTYDDGSVEDYTEAFEKAHEPEGVPASTAVPSLRVGWPGSLDADQIHEMVASGWEVMSHTVRHRALTSVGLARDVASGEEQVYVVSNLHGKLAGDRIEIFDGTNSEVVTVAGRGEDERGQYILLEGTTDHAYSVADGARERYTDAIVRAALEDSKDQLERELGVEVTNVVMPYAGYGEQPRRMVSDYYTAVANAGGYANGDKGLNPIGDFDLPHLSRRYFREGEMTEAEIRSFLDRVVDEDVVGIFGGHSTRTETLPAERIQWTIQEAKDRDIEIVTLREALADRGGSEPTTETTTETTTDSTTTESTTTETTTDSTTTEITETTTTETTTTETTTETTTQPTTTETTTQSTTSQPTTTETTSQPTTTETTTQSTTTETTTQPTTTETTTQTTSTTQPTTTETTTTQTTTESTTTETTETPIETTTTETTTQTTSTTQPTTTETTAETTTRTTSEPTTTATTTAESTTTTSSSGSNGGAPGGTGGTGNTGGTGGTGNTGGASTSTTTASTATGEIPTETTTETTSRMAVSGNETRTATKTPTTRTATPTRTSTTTGPETRLDPETTTDSTTAATESGSVGLDALGWIAALGGTGSVAAYFVTRASKAGDESDDE